MGNDDFDKQLYGAQALHFGDRAQLRSSSIFYRSSATAIESHVLWIEHHVLGGSSTHWIDRPQQTRVCVIRECFRILDEIQKSYNSERR
jgi:hypothetical protein